MQGPTEKAVLEACVKRGLPPPKAMQDAPELLQGLGFYYEAFMELHTCRDGMSGNMSWLVIWQYARAQGIEGEEEFDHFLHVIREMDSEWRDWRDKNKGDDG